jgi:cystatin-A/B
MKIFFVLFAALLSATLARPLAGGFGTVVPATAEQQELLDEVRGAVELQLGEKFNKFEAVSYTTQVVAGTNYIIVTNTGKEVLHVKLHKPLPFRGDKPFLMMVLRGKMLDSPVDPQEFV